MPYVICPVCNQSFHLLVRGNIDAWHAEHVKERTENGTPLLHCIRCWVDLRPGHKVTLRVSRPELEEIFTSRLEGTVISQNDGVFLVSFGTAQVTAIRSELSYVIGQPSLGAA